MTDLRDRTVWVQQQRAKLEDKRAKVATEQRGLSFAQAELDAKKLTAVPEWNRFLQILQGQLDTERKAQADSERTLKDPEIIGDIPLLAAKIDYLRHQERIAILEGVLEIPRTLLENPGDQ
jgi:hypothetical protein